MSQKEKPTEATSGSEQITTVATPNNCSIVQNITNPLDGQLSCAVAKAVCRALMQHPLSRADLRIYKVRLEMGSDPPQAAIAARVGCTVLTVKRAESKLESCGLLKITRFYDRRGQKTVNAYDFLDFDPTGTSFSVASQTKVSELIPCPPDQSIRVDTLPLETGPKQGHNGAKYQDCYPMMNHDDEKEKIEKEMFELLDFLDLSERVKRIRESHCTLAYCRAWRSWWDCRDEGRFTNAAGYVNSEMREGRWPSAQLPLRESALDLSELQNFKTEPPPSPSPLEKIWGETQAALKGQMTQATFDTHLKDSQLLKQDGDHYLVGVSTSAAKDWLTRPRLRGVVERALAGVVGSPVELEFEVKEPVRV